MYGIIPQCGPSSAKLGDPGRYSYVWHNAHRDRENHLWWGETGPRARGSRLLHDAASLDRSWIHRTLPRHAEIDPTGGKVCRFRGVTAWERAIAALLPPAPYAVRVPAPLSRS